MNNKNKGWTLVEVTVVLTIFVILSFSIYEIIIQVWRFYKINSVQKELQEEALTIFELISKDLREGDVKTLKISRDSAPHYSKIEIKVKGRNVKYYQQRRSLIREFTKPDGVVNSKVLSNNVYLFSAFNEKFYEPQLVTVSLTLEKDLYGEQKKALYMGLEKIKIEN